MPQVKPIQPNLAPPDHVVPTTPASHTVFKREVKGDKIVHLATAAAGTAGTALVERVMALSGEHLGDKILGWWKSDHAASESTAPNHAIKTSGCTNFQPLAPFQSFTVAPNVDVGAELILPRHFLSSPHILVPWVDGATTKQEYYLVFTSWNRKTARSVLTFVASALVTVGQEQLGMHFSNIYSGMWQDPDWKKNEGALCSESFSHERKYVYE